MSWFWKKSINKRIFPSKKDEKIYEKNKNKNITYYDNVPFGAKDN